ncbi:hypothetical protein JW813_09165 [Clostridium botulinum]|uniref:hypothetical protein n=1 Tax=Clostridium botulinum TaxID=1491 RepID=UPI00077476C8|nr:hypothetical protein [Clostridium botulinum]MBN1048730.1 hypothetical protein [Clostridium botulinum]MBN1071169.1 hypothetical protein [Clostridium botulinum]MBY6761759.1 hypothetical protein [Clostridium botulinum]MBY7025190.1 hypothetical protein [Clostridium botulinum]NFE73355.1 hypothetical protein [Clostridium botulinum]
MGRAENRRIQRKVNKKIGKQKVNNIVNGIDQELINSEIDRKCKVFQGMIVDSVVEAMKRNGLTNSQMKRISDDIELILRKKVHGVE